VGIGPWTIGVLAGSNSWAGQFAAYAGECARLATAYVMTGYLHAHGSCSAACEGRASRSGNLTLVVVADDTLDWLGSELAAVSDGGCRDTRAYLGHAG
jgi:tagatose-1,6-bisphosphate aldolase non-catalytic subunit AgaZ/GatZ